jgi:hypothetical protein
MTNSSINCIIEEMDLTKLSKQELLAKSEEHEIKKYKSKNKSELIEYIKKYQQVGEVKNNIELNNFTKCDIFTPDFVSNIMATKLLNYGK